MNAVNMDCMPTIGDYQFPARDSEDKFFGNWLIYLCWDNHLMYCAPFCVPLPTNLPFGALVRDVLPMLFGEHPEFEQIDWQRVRWSDSSDEFLPDFGKSLAQHGFGHKTLIRFKTPALEGSRGHIDNKQLAF
ncbi:MAG: phenol hydroxylase subunit P4 [Gammaproteobacteria bacterium]|nr:phenol hydroxylase subunit P4 [Gammaproteobacteria bacterium]